jgi:hypothetical protein
MRATLALQVRVVAASYGSQPRIGAGRVEQRQEGLDLRIVV